jgi:endo-1,4-beta-xylanase
LTQAHLPVADAILAHADLTGVVVRAAWPDVEPSEGQYDFGYLDRELSRVAGAGKLSSLVVTSGGRTTPTWLLQQGVELVEFRDENRFHATYGQSLRIPVFWDAALLAAKRRLIAKLGERYGADPRLALVSAHCANATTDDWNIPNSPEAAASFERMGFSEAKLLAACQDVVAATMQAFPRALVRIAVGRVPHSLSPKPDDLVRKLLAWADQQYAGRLIAQRHNLAAPTPLPGSGDQLFGWEVIHDRRPRTGAQFLWPASDVQSCRLDKGNAPCDPLRMFQRAADAALAYGVSYVEVYAADLVNPSLKGEVRRLASGLQGQGTGPKASAGVEAKTEAPGEEEPQGAPPSKAFPPEQVTHQQFVGPTTGQSIAFSVYVPKDYARAKTRLPVIYWLHGKNGDERRGVHVAGYLDSAIAAGTMPPCIMVFPNGGKASFYTDRADGTWPIETMIGSELVAHVDQHYRTIPGREGRLLMGFSMGGFGALKLAAKYPERFSAVVAYGAPRLDASLGMRGQDADAFRLVFGGNDQQFESNTPAFLFRANREKIQRLGLSVRLVAGSEDGTRFSVQKLDEVLSELGIAHEYVVLPGVRHSVGLYYAAEAGAGFAFLGRSLKQSKAPAQRR